MRILFASAFLVLADQISKAIIRQNMNLYESIVVIPSFFHITYITNDGMAFGLSFPGGKFVLLSLILLLTAFITGLLWKERDGHPLVK